MGNGIKLFCQKLTLQLPLGHKHILQFCNFAYLLNLEYLRGTVVCTSFSSRRRTVRLRMVSRQEENEGPRRSGEEKKKNRQAFQE